jgi:hypothetical protein
MSDDDLRLKIDQLHLSDPRHWLGRAEEARSIADGMFDPTTKATMLRIADGYEKMAEHARSRCENAKVSTSA